MEHYLGENLRKLRKLHERKQADIALHLGISTRQYRKMENNDIPVRSKYLIRLAQCYNVSIDQVIDFNVNRLLKKSLGSINRDNVNDIARNDEYRNRIQAKNHVIKDQQEFIHISKRK